jgi:hypothetical protein
MDMNATLSASPSSTLAPPARVPDERWLNHTASCDIVTPHMALGMDASHSRRARSVPLVYCRRHDCQTRFS